MNTQVQVTTTVQALPAGAWDGLRPGPFAGARWLRLLEQTLSQHEPRLLVVYSDGQPLAGAACFLQRRFHLEAHLGSPRLRRGLAALLARWPVFTCGLPEFGQPGVVLAPGVDLVWRARLQRACRRHALRAGLLCCAWTDLPGHDLALGAARQRPSLVLAMRPRMRVEFLAPTWHLHVQALPKRHRSELRRGCQRAVEAGVRVAEVQPTAALEAHLAPLRRRVAQHHGGQDPWVAQVYGCAARVLGTDARLLVASRAGQPLACLALLSDGPHALLKWAGLDYEHSKENFVFHLLVCEAARLALAAGARTLDLGPPDYALKRTLGAAPQPASLLLAPAWPL